MEKMMATIPAGSYTFGVDIAPGTYIVSYASGKGSVEFRRLSGLDREGRPLSEPRDVSKRYDPDPKSGEPLVPIRFEAIEGSTLSVEPGLIVQIARASMIVIDDEEPLRAHSISDVSPDSERFELGGGKQLADQNLEGPDGLSDEDALSGARSAESASGGVIHQDDGEAASVAGESLQKLGPSRSACNDSVAAERQKLVSWERRLLDLSMRNRLLNLNLGARSGYLSLSEPDSKTIWSNFVENSAKVVLPLRTRRDYFDELAEYEEYRRLVEQHALEGRSLRSTMPREYDLGPNEAISDYPASEMRKRLKNIRSRARLLSEERGIDALFLVFGLLDWQDKKGKSHKAPLLLVPTSLTISRMAAPYVLERTGEDVVHNVTLSLMMDKDFNLKLPEYEQGQPLSAYLDAVQGVVESRGWKVSEAAVLGVFSFATINMYNDLENNGELIMAHPVVRTICGDYEAASSLSQGLPPLNQVRALRSEEDPLKATRVVESDASQGEAVAMAEAGYSFVLQGPPGTGKSQTITNVITSALAHGKTVLFVSEKRAALDVVKRRLEDAGLGQFLFVLHDSTTNKKDAIRNLCAQLDDVPRVKSLSHDARGKLNKLNSSANELNSYAGEISEPVQPLGISIWKAYDELVELSEAPSVKFEISGIEQLDAAGLEQMRSAVHSLAKASSSLGHRLSESPWKDVVIAWAGEEYVNDARKSVADAAKATSALLAVFKDAAEIIDFSEAPSIDSAEALVSVLSEPLEEFEEWVYAIGNVEQLQRDLEELTDLVSAYDGEIRVFGSHIEASERAGYTLGCAKKALWLDDFTVVETAATELLSKDELFVRWSEVGLSAVKDRFAALQGKLTAIRSAREGILASYIPEALELDAREMLVRFETEYTSFFKRVMGSYNDDIVRLTGLCRQISSQKMTRDEAVLMLRALCELHDFERDYGLKSAEYARDFPGLYAGEDTDCAAIALKMDAFESLCALRAEAKTLRRDLADTEVPLSACRKAMGDAFRGLLDDFSAISLRLDAFAKIKAEAELAGIPQPSVLRTLAPEKRGSLADQLRASLSSLAGAIDGLNEFCKFTGLPRGLSELEQYCKKLDDTASELPRVIECKCTIEKCEKQGLGDFIEASRKARLEPSELESAFMRRFYTGWISAALRNAGTVAAFRKASHEEAIEEFCAADQLMISMARQNVLRKLIAAMGPAADSVDARRLRREANKRSRVMPIRKIFEEMPELITLLKPCVMMSPLSVSTFLESRTITFDLVVFDEASQVCTENAVGAISRGKQVIIAGDSHQLPPTDFFSVGSSEEDIDDEEEAEIDTGDFESVLEEASMLPPVDLKWHYRSLNEGLISFSNNEIYDGKLVTFPSSNEQKTGEGVSFEYVKDGVWLGSRAGNPKEARRVAELVFKHFEAYPGRSIGVIAFGSRQATCIEDEITKLREKDHRFEDWFDEGRPDGFFVKSLENVQGDERDSIFLSVGYAKNDQGAMRMNFGPINKSGGERRLNVAVTRAKHDLTLVSSILDSDIALGEGAGRGPVVLRDYISYARKSQRLHEVLDNQAGMTGADCEARGLNGFIKSALERRGYCVETNVGGSSCKIDLAVKASKDDKDYIAGIVTDGVNYTQTQGARERDRIRPKMLSKMGWNLYRVWIPSWAENPSEELSNLLVFVSEQAAAVEKNRKPLPRASAVVSEPVLPQIKTKPVHVDKAEADMLSRTLRRHHGESSKARASASRDATVALNAATDKVRSKGASETGRNEPSDSGMPAKTPRPTRDLSCYRPDFGTPNAYGFVRYIAVPDIAQNVEMDEAVMRFLGAEAPVVSGRLLSFVRKRLGRGASYGDARDVVSRLEDAQLGYGIEVRGDFVRLSGVQDPPPRSGGRLFKEIAPAEVAAGMLGVFTAQVGSGKVTKDTLIRKTYDEFGFAREDAIPSDAKKMLEFAFQTLVAADFIQQDGPLRLTKGNRFDG